MSQKSLQSPACHLWEKEVQAFEVCGHRTPLRPGWVQRSPKMFFGKNHVFSACFLASVFEESLLRDTEELGFCRASTQTMHGTGCVLLKNDR